MKLSTDMAGAFNRALSAQPPPLPNGDPRSMLGDDLTKPLHKARSHKYIRREPDGKGGWRYWYPEPKRPREGARLSPSYAETLDARKAKARSVFAHVAGDGSSAGIREAVARNKIRPAVDELLRDMRAHVAAQKTERQAQMQEALRVVEDRLLPAVLQVKEGNETYSARGVREDSELSEALLALGLLSKPPTFTLPGGFEVEGIAEVEGDPNEWFRRADDLAFTAWQENLLMHGVRVDEDAEADNAPIFSYGKAVLGNPDARSLTLFGDHGILRDFQDNMRPHRIVISDDTGDRPDTLRTEVSSVHGAKAAAFFLSAQNKLRRYPLEQYPTLYRGAGLPKTVVESLRAGDVLPLTGVTSFTMNQSLAENFARRSYLEDRVSVLFRLARDAEFDASVAVLETGLRWEDQDKDVGAREVVSCLPSVRVTAVRRRILHDPYGQTDAQPRHIYEVDVEPATEPAQGGAFSGVVEKAVRGAAVPGSKYVRRWRGKGGGWEYDYGDGDGGTELSAAEKARARAQDARDIGDVDGRDYEDGESLFHRDLHDRMALAEKQLAAVVGDGSREAMHETVVRTVLKPAVRSFGRRLRRWVATLPAEQRSKAEAPFAVVVDKLYPTLLQDSVASGPFWDSDRALVQALFELDALEREAQTGSEASEWFLQIGQIANAVHKGLRDVVQIPAEVPAFAGFEPDTEPILTWGRAQPSNPLALAFTLYGDHGRFRDVHNDLREVYVSVADATPPSDEDNKQVHEITAARGAAMFLYAQQKLKWFSRDKHPTLYRGVRLPSSVVDTLAEGDVLPLTGATAFSMSQRFAEGFAAHPWLTQPENAEQDVGVVFRMQRSAETDASVAAAETGERNTYLDKRHVASKHGMREVVSCLPSVRVLSVEREAEGELVFVDVAPVTGEFR